MLLVIDIGNTSTRFGIYQEDNLLDSWRLSSDKNKSEDEYGIILNNLILHKNFAGKLKAAIISSVVLSLTETMTSAIEKYLNIPVFVLSSKLNTGIVLDVEKPEEVGCDRIANVCAAHNLYKTPAVVVDFGTATTFDIVSGEGRFLGGIITPGIDISAKALANHTSLLPKIKISAPDSVIGKNTLDNMLSGLVIGQAAMIDGLISCIEEELGSPVTTIATGGYSTLLVDYMKRPFDYLDLNLTLEGLKIIYNLNCAKI